MITEFRQTAAYKTYQIAKTNIKTHVDSNLSSSCLFIYKI